MTKDIIRTVNIFIWKHIDIFKRLIFVIVIPIGLWGFVNVVYISGNYIFFSDNLEKHLIYFAGGVIITSAIISVISGDIETMGWCVAIGGIVPLLLFFVLWLSSIVIFETAIPEIKYHLGWRELSSEDVCLRKVREHPTLKYKFEDDICYVKSWDTDWLNETTIKYND